MGKARPTAIRIGAATTAVALSAGCGIGAVDTETGPPRPDGREIRITVTTGRITPPTRWPDACSLLTEDELLAVLPSAEDVETWPVTENPFYSSSVPGGKAVNEQPVRNGRCIYKMEFPVYYNNARITGTGEFSIALKGVGDPRVTARVHADRKASLGASQVGEIGVDGADCYLETGPGNAPRIGFVVCRKGPVLFSIERAGFRKVDLEGDEDLDEAVRERVLAPVAETVAADLPDG
ncbi:hypothetical protein [Actinomadura sp. 3N407]|uniref:hypothetical protein n=1 Tax=Actinomadura sp. 3N407 TaxID=3457423 RepID=UPI003FCE82C7